MIYFITTAGYTKVGYSKSLALIEGRLRGQYPPDAVLQYVGEGERWTEGNAHFLLRDLHAGREWFRGEMTRGECLAIHASALVMDDVGHRSIGKATSKQLAAAGHKGAAKPRSEAHRAATSLAMRGKPKPALRGREPWNKGRTTPQAVRDKISASRKRTS